MEWKAKIPNSKYAKDTSFRIEVNWILLKLATQSNLAQSFITPKWPFPSHYLPNSEKMRPLIVKLTMINVFNKIEGTEFYFRIKWVKTISEENMILYIRLKYRVLNETKKYISETKNSLD